MTTIPDSISDVTRQYGMIDTLLDQLLLATTPQEQLDAVMIYPIFQGASAARLYYVNIDNPEMATLVAEWVLKDVKPFNVGVEVPFDGFGFPSDIDAVTSPMLPTLIEDTSLVDAPPHISLAFEHHSIAAMVLLPLTNQGQWIGAIVFSWSKSQVFGERDRRIYTQIIQLSTAAIHVVRLLEQTRRRTQDLEVANNELDLLYRASEAINLANTYQELIEAVAQFDPESDVVTLILWDGLDWESADYGMAVALIDRTNSSVLQIGSLFNKASFPIGDTMMGERVWIFNDMHTDPRIDPLTRESWDALQIRAFMGPALYNHKAWMGGITYHSSVPRNYTQHEARLFAAIGDLVSAAVRRIHLQQETDTLRQRAEILARVNASLLQAKDELDILDSVALYTSTLGIYDMALSYSFDEPNTNMTWRRLVAYWQDGYATEFDETIHPTIRMKSAELSELWFEFPFQGSTEAYLIEDVVTDERLNAVTRQEFQRQVPYRGMAILPLAIGEQRLGVLRIAWLTPHFFTEFEQSIYQSFVRILPFVVATRRNFLAERQRANELEGIARLSAAAANRLDETNLLQTITELANQQFSQYTFVIFLLDESKEHLEWFNSTEHERISVGDASSPAASVMRERQSVVINNLEDANRYRVVSLIDSVQSMMALPIIASDEIIGVLEIQSTQAYRFSQDDIRIMEILADLIAVAIQNARLYQRSMSFAVVEERNRLARELHDSVSQAMYGIALGARTARTMLDRDISKLAEPLDYVLALSEAGLAEMRALIFELRPETLDKEGLVEALSRQVTMLEARHGIRVTLEAPQEPHLPFKIKEAIYWILREALHNIVKHARATEIQIVMTHDDQTIAFIVSDNGIGFNPNDEFKGHMGLQSMHERCQKVDGTLIIDSQVGQGSTITLQIPIN